jgi:hypothetical protein
LLATGYQNTTFNGGKQFHELKDGEIICGYNKEKRLSEWQKLTGFFLIP